MVEQTWRWRSAADYAYILEMGAIVAQGSGAELEADTRVQEAYLSL